MEFPAHGRYANAGLSPLEDDAMAWLDGFYQLEHLIATRMWAVKICPEASPEVKFAALTHDAERFFPGGPSSTPSNGFDDPDYLFAHSTRSANIVEEWLRSRTPAPDEAFIRRVRRLILRHEIGGGWEADFVQAADSPLLPGNPGLDHRRLGAGRPLHHRAGARKTGLHRRAHPAFHRRRRGAAALRERRARARRRRGLHHGPEAAPRAGQQPAFPLRAADPWDRLTPAIPVAPSQATAAPHEPRDSVPLRTL